MNQPYQFHKLTDSQLYSLCTKYGANARIWMRKFAGLLPEVFRRKLYKRKGFISIHEFAKKLAGMTEENVDRILRLSERLSDKPILKSKLETGEVGWSKLEKVSYIATKETEAQWAEKVERLSKPALEEYIKEYKNQNGTNFRLKSLPGNKSENNQASMEDEWNRLSFSVSQEIEEKLRLLKQQIEKETREPLGWNSVMGEILKRLEAKEVPVAKRETIIQLCPDCIKRRANEAEEKKEVTRYIPAEIQKVIQARSKGICEFPECHRAGKIYHHTRRYALKRNHDPEFIVFLCKAHEGILQAGLIENEEKQPLEWRLLNEPDQDDLKILIDERVREFRKDLANLPEGNRS